MASDSLLEAVDEMLGMGPAACSQPVPITAACKRKLPEDANIESDGLLPSKRMHGSEEESGTAASATTQVGAARSGFCTLVSRTLLTVLLGMLDIYNFVKCRRRHRRCQGARPHQLAPQLKTA